jgi:hypothetical protein
LTNDRYDEAYEVSQSLDQSAAAVPKPRVNPAPAAKASSIPEEREAKGMSRNNEATKSQSVLINSSHFDEALEFSRSGSDESVDTVGSSPGHHRHQKPAAAAAPMSSSIQQQQIPQMSAAQRNAASQLNTQESPPAKKPTAQVCTLLLLPQSHLRSHLIHRSFAIGTEVLV